jgi:DNA-binding CsgD family transcriptional regulator
VVNDRARADERLVRANERLERIGAALGAGIILLDSNRQVVWMDKRTRARLNGGLERLASTLPARDSLDGVLCSVSPAEVTINGEAAIVCLVQETEEQAEHGFDVIAALETAMADTSWFTRTIVAKLKALRHASHPAPPISDLEMLTDRERQVLALICEGHSDAEMGAMLKLSQNTVRNHIASLYRKIGVNRRSAAIIWARERGITPQDVMGDTPRSRPRPNRLSNE